ncbi:hypothetical protein D3C84_716650 [compost metagenome]
MASQYMPGFFAPEVAIQQLQQGLAKLLLDLDIHLGLVAQATGPFGSDPLGDQQLTHLDHVDYHLI